MQTKTENMRIILTFVSQSNQVTTFDYLYYVSSWIYSVFRVSNPEYATILHNSGKIKGFTFSPFFFYNSKIEKNTINVDADSRINLTISFKNQNMAMMFIKGLSLNTVYKIGELNLLYVDYRLEQKHINNTYKFTAASPIYLTNHLGESLHPSDTDYEYQFFKNLNSKLDNKYDDDTIRGFSIVKCSKPESKLKFVIKSDGSKIGIKGYRYSFSLHCPNDIAEAGYMQGFGRLNSQGYGFAK
jgi:CRISPR-associated endoribonuclease Cas6